MPAIASIGECVHCDGPLCVNGRKVSCERCGIVAQDHPFVLAAAAVKEVPASHVIPAEQMEGMRGDRMKDLERRVAALEAAQVRYGTRKGA